MCCCISVSIGKVLFSIKWEFVKDEILLLLLLVTKSVKWRYLGNQAWYHRSGGVKTTGKILKKKIKKKKRTKWLKMVKIGQTGQTGLK